MPWRREGRLRKPRRPKLLTSMCAGKTYCLAGKVWGRERGISHISPDGDIFFLYCQTDGPQKPGHCWWEHCTQWCWWACAHWRRQDEGLGWTLCQAAQCWIWVVKQQAPRGPSNCWLPPSVSATLIRKALSKMKCSTAAGPSGIIAEMLKGAGAGRSWADKTTDRGCFHLQCEPIRLAGELNSFWISRSIRARVKLLTMATIMVSSSQIKSWSCWNGY